jgi:hypothetical protein
MKTLTYFILLLFAGITSHAQTIVYDKYGHKQNFKTEQLDLDLKTSSVAIPTEVFAPLIAAAIPTVVDMVFRLTEKQLEKNVKKYLGEYTAQQSYLQAGSNTVPEITLTRTLNGDPKPVFLLRLNPIKVDGLDYFVYDVDRFVLKLSSAKSTSKQLYFDYTIELKVTYLDEGERKISESAPIVIKSKTYNDSVDPSGHKYRSSLLPLKEGSIITDIALKVIETNTGKVRAEKMLSIFNENKDDIRTIVNNFIPKTGEKKEADKEEKEKTPAKDGVVDGTGATGHPSTISKKGK